MVNLEFLDIERIKEKAEENRTRENGNGIAPIQKARYILRLLEKSNFRCILCGTTKKLTIHHLVPPLKTKGGKNRKMTAKNYEKCIVACEQCHNEIEEEKKRQFWRKR